MRLRARDLVKAYRAADGRALRVLEGVSLEGSGGELVAVIGTSGSGKSTLLNVLGLLEPADSGEIWHDEVRVSHLGRRAQAQIRGRHIGYVFQSFMLIARLTALENIALAGRYVGRDRRDAERAALALMERMGVADRRGHYPPQLSGGEQQRVAFCRAVFNAPDLLLADEPTGNLDEDNARAILAELRSQAADRGALVVLVTHRADAAAMADRAWRIHQGRLEPA